MPSLLFLPLHNLEIPMKTILINIVLVVVFTIAVPGVAAAQSLCEGLTTMLTGDRDDLDLFMAPGATECKRRRGMIACSWQKAFLPSNQTRKAKKMLMPDVKKLASAVKQCITQKKILPYTLLESGRMNEGDKGQGFYFEVRRDGDKRKSAIAVCFQYARYYGANTAIVLAVDQWVSDRGPDRYRDGKFCMNLVNFTLAD